MTTYIEMMKEELKNEFFPFRGLDDCEEKIFKNFSEYNRMNMIKEGNFILSKNFGKKHIFVYYKDVILDFIYNEKDLVILIITDINSFDRDLNLLSLVTRSVTKIDFVASDSWLEENSYFVNMVKLISLNSSHIGKEILIKGSDKLINVSEDIIKSPLLWYLLKEPNIVKRGYKSSFSALSAKTKGTFLSGVMKITMNSIYQKDTKITDNQMKKSMDKFFAYLTSSIIRNSSRKYIFEDIKTRNGVLLDRIIYTDLFDNFKFDKVKFDNWLNAEFYPYFKFYFIEYLEGLLVANDIDRNVLNAIFANISRLNKKYLRSGEDQNIHTVLFVNNGKLYEEIILKLISLVEDNFSENIFLNTYESRKDKKAKEIKFMPNEFWLDIYEEASEMAETDTIQFHSLPPQNSIDIFDDGIPF